MANEQLFAMMRKVFSGLLEAREAIIVEVVNQASSKPRSDISNIARKVIREAFGLSDKEDWLSGPLAMEMFKIETTNQWSDHLEAAVSYIVSEAKYRMSKAA